MTHLYTMGQMENQEYEQEASCRIHHFAGYSPAALIDRAPVKNIWHLSPKSSLANWVTILFSWLI